MQKNSQANRKKKRIQKLKHTLPSVIKKARKTDQPIKKRFIASGGPRAPENPDLEQENSASSTPPPDCDSLKTPKNEEELNQHNEEWDKQYEEKMRQYDEEIRRCDEEIKRCEEQYDEEIKRCDEEAAGFTLEFNTQTKRSDEQRAEESGRRCEPSEFLTLWNNRRTMGTFNDTRSRGLLPDSALVLQNNLVALHDRNNRIRYSVKLEHENFVAGLERGFFESCLIGIGRSVVSLGQGIKQLGLEAGERFGVVEHSVLERYTNEINEESRLYYHTPVGQSWTGRGAELATDIGATFLLPGGVGLRGTRFIASTMGTGAVIGGTRITQDGLFTSRLQNMAEGALWGAGAAVGTQYLLPRARDTLMFLYNGSRNQISHGALRLQEFGKPIVSNYRLRSPIVFQFEQGRLYSSVFGLPPDAIRLRAPWAPKDLLSQTGRLHPEPLLSHEIQIVERWELERVTLMDRLRTRDLSMLEPGLRSQFNSTFRALRDHMTPDDLAAIFKENRGIKIYKGDGDLYNHVREWDSVQQCFKKAFREAERNGLTAEQVTVANQQLGDISRLWTRFKKIILRAQNVPEDSLRP